MYKCDILLDTVDKIKDFVRIVSVYDCDFDIRSGRYIVDGKSIMGIFALDTSKPHELDVISDDEMLFKELRIRLANFIV